MCELSLRLTAASGIFRSYFIRSRFQNVFKASKRVARRGKARSRPSGAPTISPKSIFHLAKEPARKTMCGTPRILGHRWYLDRSAGFGPSTWAKFHASWKEWGKVKSTTLGNSWLARFSWPDLADYVGGGATIWHSAIPCNTHRLYYPTIAIITTTNTTIVIVVTINATIITTIAAVAIAVAVAVVLDVAKYQRTGRIPVKPHLYVLTYPSLSRKTIDSLHATHLCTYIQ